MDQTKSNLYKEAFRTAAGKAVLKDLEQFCHANNVTYVIGDPHHTAFNEGMRRVYLRIQSFINNKEEVQNGETIQSSFSSDVEGYGS